MQLLIANESRRLDAIRCGQSLALVSLLSVALFPATAHAQKEQAALAAQNETLQRALGDAEARCKFKLKASIDVESFAAVAKANPERVGSLARHCKAPIAAITEWCAMGLGESIGKDVQSIQCHYSEKGEPSAVKDGVLIFSTPWAKDTNQWSTFAKAETGRLLRHGEFSAAQAALIRNDNGRVKDVTADMARRCGGTMPKWTIDWKSFEGEVDKRTQKNDLRAIWQECYEPLRVLELRCNNSQADLVTAQVKSFMCRFDAKSDTTMTLDKKTLTYTSNFKLEKPREWVTENVGDLLRDGDFSARQTDFIKEENANFQRVFVDYLKSDCDIDLKWEIDWESLRGELDKRLSKEETTSIYDACAVPVGRILGLCARDKNVAKKARKKFKSFKCAAAGKKGRSLKRKKTALNYAVSFTAKDSYTYVDKFLVKQKVLKKRPPPKKLSPEDLSRIQRAMGGGTSGKTKCRRACSKKCRAASNRSKCLTRCRSGC